MRQEPGEEAVGNGRKLGLVAQRVVDRVPVADQYVADGDDLLLFGVAHRIGDDFRLVPRPVLVAELLQQSLLLKRGKSLGQGILNAIQRFLGREGGAKRSELLLLFLVRRPGGFPSAVTA